MYTVINILKNKQIQGLLILDCKFIKKKETILKIIKSDIVGIENISNV